MKMSRKLPLNGLRAFEAVARLKSFTKAGEELGMTQTAVSYQIKLLEDHLDRAVFLREARSISLTATGELLIPKVTEAFSLLSDAIADAKQEAEGVLEIRSTPTFASHWLARHIGSFQLSHPGLAVRILRAEKPVDFRTENADVVIWRAEQQPADVEAHELFRLNYAPMLSPKLAETIGGVTTPMDLLKLPLIGGSNKWWGIWFRSNGIDIPLPGTITIDADGALDLEGSAAIAGHGVALLSPFLHGEELEAGRLIMPFDVFKKDDHSYWLIYPKNRRRMAKIQAFRDWLPKKLADDLRLLPMELSPNASILPPDIGNP
ncbi:LysR substrate-binding domain-containing protein [Rhizobium rhizoryzae]|uniref:LysR family glycine cleavage system transcriptional activator n=1 Tax=Rhizobium rhizoryzae TaxID=451876 RepID=A0A7W6PQD5_9HYPH|nr:LysR substrate-binding domain-containing protein [Rhizobium rhizoryzae]MBB4141570.1 LysR family glycine cleavage system transcriptional activator [Rhizobium rhizoryzae]